LVLMPSVKEKTFGMGICQI